MHQLDEICYQKTIFKVYDRYKILGRKVGNRRKNKKAHLIVKTNTFLDKFKI